MQSFHTLSAKRRPSIKERPPRVKSPDNAQRLLAWTTTCTTRTSVASGVASDRVIRECDDDTAGANGDARTHVPINLVPRNLDASCASVTAVTGSDAVATVVRDLIVMGKYTDSVSRRGVTEDAVTRVVGEHAITSGHK